MELNLKLRDKPVNGVSGISIENQYVIMQEDSNTQYKNTGKTLEIPVNIGEDIKKCFFQDRKGHKWTPSVQVEINN